MPVTNILRTRPMPNLILAGTRYFSSSKNISAVLSCKDVTKHAYSRAMVLATFCEVISAVLEIFMTSACVGLVSSFITCKAYGNLYNT